jgi:hypothetical protein
MNIGSSLESAISSLQRNVENAKSVASQISNEDVEETSSSSGVNSNAGTVGQMVDERV